VSDPKIRAQLLRVSRDIARAATRENRPNARLALLAAATGILTDMDVYWPSPAAPTAPVDTESPFTETDQAAACG
jgi:hypothetical protein